MLLTLLTAIASVTILVGAASEAIVQYGLVKGLLVGAVLGLPLAVLSYYVVAEVLFGSIANYISKRSERVFIWYCRIMYPGVAVMAVLNVGIGHLSVSLLRLAW